MLPLTERQQALFKFVCEQHAGQVRKYTGEPYSIHLYNVAKIIAPFDTLLLVEIAMCHDLFEDTRCNDAGLYMFLKHLYSITECAEIIDGVRYLTDKYTSDNYPLMNRFKRKFKECERLSKIPGHIQTVKYADLIDNTSSIIQYDPGFAKVYLAEKRALLRVMKNGNPDLYINCCGVLYEAEKKLNLI